MSEKTLKQKKGSTNKGYQPKTSTNSFRKLLNGKVLTEVISQYGAAI